MSKNRFLDSRHNLLVIVLVLLILAIPFSYFVGGLLLALLMAGAICFTLGISQLIWASPNYGKLRISLAVLNLVAFLSYAVIQGNHWFLCLLEILKQSELPWEIKIENALNCLRHSITVEPYLILTVILFNILSIYLILQPWRDRTAIQKNPISIEPEFEEKSYQERLKDFCDILKENPEYSNDRTFSENDFIPLQAERETSQKNNNLSKILALIPFINSKGNKNKKIREKVDLLTFINSELKTKNILLLGDSGAGKSCTLSALEKIFLEKINDTNPTPIYINCKHWTYSKEWVQGKDPTVADLKKFIYDSLYNRVSGTYSEDFLDEYFDKMLENGKFLLLLDSFDEIPAILDVKESDDLIEKLSKAIEIFLAEIKSPCIITSRLDKKPKLKPDDLSILEILPFSDLQIKKALHESIEYNKDRIIKELFRNRTELIPIARNPFMMALLGQYVSTKKRDRLPNKQIELYENHLEIRLESSQCQKKLEELSVARIINICVDIAWLMFKNNYGLEISLLDLQKELQIISFNQDISKIIEILKVAGLARSGGANKENFSFVHRHFNDYLVAEYLLSHPNEVSCDKILDPKWRDILVLYYDSVSSEEPQEQEAKKIANFCCQKIKQTQQSCPDRNHNNELDALYSIRFLANAFKSRPEYIKDIQPDIFQFIQQQVKEKNNIFFAKTSIEAVGILTDEQIERICLIALEKNNDLISETAIRYCRHLPKTSKELQLAVIDYHELIPPLEFIQKRKEILFNCELADGFKRIKRYCYARNIDYFILIGLLFLRLFSLAPLFATWFLASILTCLSYILIQLISNESGDLTISQLISKHFLHNTTLVIVRYFAVFFALIELLCLSLLPSTYKEVYLSRFLPILDLIYSSRTVLFSVLLIMTWAFLIFSIPWYRLPDSLQRLPDLIKKHLNWKSFLVLISLLLLIIVPMYNQDIKTFIDTKVWPGFLVFMGLTSIVLAIKFVRDSYKEDKLLTTLKQTRIESREDIEKYFKQFHTRKYRLKYAKFIANRFRNKTPTGFWTNNKPPNYRNYRNDRASILLAELEEKWRRLN